MEQPAPASLTLSPKPYEDKLWRLSNLYKIRAKTGIITFKPNPLQLKILEDVKGQVPIRHITLKCRQVGVSTFWLLYYLDDTLFRSGGGVISGIMSHELDSIQHLASIIEFALSSLPGKKVQCLQDNVNRKTFAHNNSTIMVDLEFRSTPLHNLHISEWAFCENQRIWATLGASSKYCNITGETTGNGMGNDFYMTYMDALEKKNEYRRRFIPWFEHAEYRLPMNGMPPFKPDERERSFKLDQEQIHYRRQMQRKLKAGFYIEYPEQEEDCWGQSGLMFFDNKKIIRLAKECRELDDAMPPKEDTTLYTVWEEPQAGHVYAMGADPAEGVDGDNSAFKIMCVTCRAEAMSFKGHVGIDLFYVELDKWGRKYNNALLGVERNNHGHAVLLGLRENCKYPHLYMEVREEPIVVNLAKIRPEPKYGWLTNSANKAMVCDHLKWALEGDPEEDEDNFRPDFLVRDTNLLSECLTFQKENGKLGATEGQHDDVVMASAVCYQMFRILRSKLTKGSGINFRDVITGGRRKFTI